MVLNTINTSNTSNTINTSNTLKTFKYFKILSKTGLNTKNDTFAKMLLKTLQAYLVKFSIYKKTKSQKRWRFFYLMIKGQKHVFEKYYHKSI